MSVTFILTGPLGLLVLVLSSLVALAALASGSRAVFMSVLLLPSTLLFSGLPLI